MKKFLLRVLSLLTVCALMLTLCGCSKKETVSNKEVRLSNTKFSDSELSSSEKKLLKEAEEALSLMQYRLADNTMQGEISFDNLLNFKVYVLFYNDKDVIVSASSLDLDGLEKGRNFEIKLYASNSGKDPAYAQIAGEFTWENSYYRTDFVPLELLNSASANVQIKGGTPYTFKHSDYRGDYSHTFHNIITTYDSVSDYYDFTIELTKDAGPIVKYSSIPYRIVNSDKVVYATGSLDVSMLQEGDRALAYIDYVKLPAGDYYIEFYEA